MDRALNKGLKINLNLHYANVSHLGLQPFLGFIAIVMIY